MIKIPIFCMEKSRWKAGVALVYFIFLGIAVVKHEPWFDEAQAWLLARDAGYGELLVRYLRYEGSPGLWHTILTIPAKLGLPYITMNIISALLAAAGAFLFVQYSPFPLVIKLLYPFTFFAFYQYAVVARSYTLIPVLMFSIAIVYKDRVNKPFLFFALLILLANASFHGVIIASSLALIHLFEVNNNRVKITRLIRYKNICGLLVFVAVILLLKLQLQPPDDLITVANINKDISKIFAKCIPALLGALASNNPPDPVKYTIVNIFFNLLSILVMAATLYWLILQRKLLTFLIPIFSMFIFFTLVYVHEWHWGILFYIWMFVLWISFEEIRTKSNNSENLIKTTKTAVTFCVTAVLLVQVYWSFHSLSYDFFRNYSASREAADYIKEEHLENKKIYASNFHSNSILPYFPSNIFCNYNNRSGPSFWIWSSENSMYGEPYLSIDKYDPDIIILGIKSFYPDKNNIDTPYIPDIPGYRLSRVFTGALYWKNKPLETDSFIVFEK